MFVIIHMDELEVEGPFLTEALALEYVQAEYAIDVLTVEELDCTGDMIIVEIDPPKVHAS